MATTRSFSSVATTSAPAPARPRAGTDSVPSTGTRWSTSRLPAAGRHLAARSPAHPARTPRPAADDRLPGPRTGRPAAPAAQYHPAGLPRPPPTPPWGTTRSSASTPCSAPPRSTGGRSTSPTWSSSCSPTSSRIRTGCTPATVGRPPCGATGTWATGGPVDVHVSRCGASWARGTGRRSRRYGGWGTSTAPPTGR